MLILGVSFYIVSIVLGFLLSDHFFSKYVDLSIVRFAMGIPIGFALATYIVLLSEVATGAFYDWLVLFAILLMLAIISYLYQNRVLKKKSSGGLVRELKDYKIFYGGVFLITAILIILQSQGLHANATGIMGGDNFGTDLLFHLGIGNSLIYSGFPPKFPYANGATNVYPFISDFYAAILIHNNIGIVPSLYLMNFLLYFSIVAIGSYLFYRLSKNQFVPVVAIVTFLFCGQGLSLLIMSVFHIPLPQYSLPSPSTLGNIFSAITYPFFNFVQPLINNFAPQHDYLLGFPYTLVVITVLYLIFLDEPRPRPTARVLFLGLLAGLLPLIHPDSFIFLLVFGFVLLIHSLCTRSGAERTSTFKWWIMLGMITLGVSIPEILFMRSQPLAVGLVTEAITNPVWYSVNANPLSLVALHIIFWIEVLGAIFVIGLAGIFLLKKNKIVVFVPPLILFMVVNLVWFPPGFGDSNKFTLYLIFFLAFSSTVLLSRLFRRKSKLLKVIAIFLFISMIFNGVIEEYFDFHATYTIASNIALNASSWLINNTSPSSLFVTNCYHDLFDYLPTIAGRSTLLDMERYVYPVGIYSYNIAQVSYGIDNFVQNPSCAFSEEYHIDYVVISHITSYMTEPIACSPTNYTNVLNSANLTMIKRFENETANESILIFKTVC